MVRRRDIFSASFCLLSAVLFVTPGIAEGDAKPPANFAALSSEADAARDSNHLDAAVPLYRKALNLRPNWSEGWWSLGTIFYDKDSYLAAAHAFRRLVEVDPKNGTGYLMLGLCEFQLNRFSASMMHIQRAKELGIKKDDQLEHVLLYHEGLLWLQQGSYENAVEPLGSLVKQGVRSEELDVAIGKAVLLVPAGNTFTDDERQLLITAGRAEESSMTRNPEAARQGYGNLARDFPDFPNVHYAYARFLLSVEETEDARAQFLEEIKRQPGHVRALMEIASSYYRAESALGIPYVQEVVKRKPAYPFGHYLLGLLYFDSGKVAESIPELEASARMVPHEAQFQFALGNAYARAGRKVDAARARAEFRRLGGDSQSSSGAATYGDRPGLTLPQNPKVQH